LGNEKFAVAEDETGCDFNGFHKRVPCCVFRLA
jgi:hypothetical protein